MLKLGLIKRKPEHSKRDSRIKMCPSHSLPASYGHNLQNRPVLKARHLGNIDNSPVSQFHV